MFCAWYEQSSGLLADNWMKVTKIRTNWTKLLPYRLFSSSFFIVHIFRESIRILTYYISTNFKYCKCRRYGRVWTRLIEKEIEQKFVALTFFFFFLMKDWRTNEWISCISLVSLTLRYSLATSFLSSTLEVFIFALCLCPTFNIRRFVEGELTQSS